MEHKAYLEMADVESRHWWFVGRRYILQRLIKSLDVTDTAKILELGSGTGGNLQMLAQFGKVTAVEMNDTARKISEAKGLSAEILPGVLPDQLQLGDRKFDLVVLLDVLEHIEHDQKTLATINNLLTPNGLAIITVPAYRILFSEHDRELHHKRRYERDELMQKIQKSGLTIKKLCFFNTILLPVAFALRLLCKQTGSEVPPHWLNAVLKTIFCSEGSWLPWINPPFGLSILAVVGRSSTKADLKV